MKLQPEVMLLFLGIGKLVAVAQILRSISAAFVNTLLHRTAAPLDLRLCAASSYFLDINA